MSSPPRSLLIAAGVVALMSLGMAACGGGDGSEEDDTGAGGATGSVSEVGADPAARSEQLAAEARRLIPIASASQEGKPRKQQLRIADAQGELLVIAEEDPTAIKPLIDALEKPDYELIVRLINFYVQLGHPGSERALIEALNRQEATDPTTSHVAFTLLESGNRKLIRSTEEWADRHGFTITGTPSGVGPKWGQTGIGDPTVGIPGP